MKHYFQYSMLCSIASGICCALLYRGVLVLYPFLGLGSLALEYLRRNARTITLTVKLVNVVSLATPTHIATVFT